MSPLPIPDLHPSVTTVRAILTAKWGKSGYRPMPIRTVESYYVDTALDSDADTWNLEIGDPRGEITELLNRDNEVRVQLFGVGKQSTNPLMTGIADEISMDEDGTITLVGRDMSSLATDSDVPPAHYRHVRAWSIVEQQAKELGFRQTKLARYSIVKKAQYTDGSENYWEFWYRLYRKEKMWLWTEPTGLLIADRLHYSANPTYFFGEPASTEDAGIRARYIPIIGLESRKSTQQRIWEVMVYFHKGDNGSRVISHDTTIKDWIKRPRRILLDTEATTGKTAQKLGWEEIFEGKVGSMEIRITIPDPGFPIRQDKIARLRYPRQGIVGEFYIVGVRQQGGPDGILQQVRLRERHMALTRRVPTSPKARRTEEPRRVVVREELGAGVVNIAPGMPEQWGQWFINAANEWHGPWDYNLFLSTLIAIADQETSFHNYRAFGGPGGDRVEWYPWKVARHGPTYGEVIGERLGAGEAPETGVALDAEKRTRNEWERLFANVPSKWTSQTWAVGPMQLYTEQYKLWADDHMKLAFRDQYSGGRWHPEHNIWAGARALRNKLQAAVGDSGRDIDMWAGVSYYGHHYNDESPSTVPTRYAISVKNKVYNDPGYLTGVSEALSAARDTADAVREGQSDAPGIQSDPDIQGLPTYNEVRHFYSNYNPNTASVTQKRQAIVNAAMWGYFNEPDIHYVSENTNPQNLGQRFKDFEPPPNVPDYTDCSGFVTWCYKSAGANDPNDNEYGGGYTGTLWTTGTEISVAQLRPGDLVFWGNPMSPGGGAHVAVYVGQGKIVSHGADDQPICKSMNYRESPVGFRTYTLGGT